MRIESGENSGVSRFSLLDAGERVAILLLYAYLCSRILLGSMDGNTVNLLLLPSEGIVVLFVLFRRPASELSMRGTDWAAAIVATVMPLLVKPSGDSFRLLPDAAAASMIVIGILVQVHAKLILGRSIGCIPAHRGLKLSGPYRFVRHPMYTGYFLTHLAFLSINPTPWNAGVYLACYLAQIPRILAEERLLGGDPLYRDYMSRVRYRLLPGVF